MHWEELTGNLFSEAVKTVGGVCLLPLSCIERHAHHLPLGTDMYIAREMCKRAAALEPAIIFPDFIFTQILEARHCAGTVAIDIDLSLKLLDNVCREISRNGLNKIVLVNAHGGNGALLPLFMQIQLGSPRDYVVYLAHPILTTEQETELETTLKMSTSDHAGESETSQIMVIRPDLVRREQIRDDGEGTAQGRLPLRSEGIDTAIWWYADHPTHYAGDATKATPEKGEWLLNARAEALARAIHRIKMDGEARRLQELFFGASESHPAP